MRRRHVNDAAGNQFSFVEVRLGEVAVWLVPKEARSAGALDDVTRDALWKEAAEAIDAAVAAAESAPMPDAAEALEDVFAGTIEEGWA